MEQAKGVLSARAGIIVGDAFHRMRGYARRNHLTLTSVATAVVDGEIPVDLLALA